MSKQQRVPSIVFDYALPPLFLALTVGLTYALLETSIPTFWVGSLAVAPFVATALVLERARPERQEYVALDQPFATDAAHFLLNYQLGYALALGGCALLGWWIAAFVPLWPTAWPLAAQILLAAFVAEGVSYWQHRLVHRVPWLWRFHALHHSGERLNLIRAGRFHFVDIGTGALLVFAPLVLLGAPERIIVWTAALTGVLGVLEHANMRMRTPKWLDWLLCTPAVHRHHHSRDRQESNGNFGTIVMCFDVLFGTYHPPRKDGPAAIGVENDPTPPTGFWQQVIGPFRRSRAP